MKKVFSRKTTPAMAKKDKSELREKDNSIGNEIDNFVKQIESLATTLSIVASVMTMFLAKTKEDLDNFVKSAEGMKSIKKSIKKKTDVYKIKGEAIPKFEKLMHNLDISQNALRITPKSFIVSLVSQYDAFLGRLLKKIFYLKPELLNASERRLMFSELVKLDSVDKAREYIIEKEVESIIRESHTYHFDWMEKRFSVHLRKELEAWPNFIELTERRNLFVHCDGVISSQYIDNCKAAGVSIKESVVVGKRLSVDPEYFKQAQECMAEIGVKLGQVLWRKLVPNDIAIADSNFNDICYELIVDENYSLAKKLLQFAVSIKKYSSDEIHRQLLVNLAQAYRWSGEIDRCNQLIGETDWSACADKFKLAISVLKDDFTDAKKIMKRIGRNGEIDKTSYKEWPLFKKFRQSPQFLETYKELFGEEFSVIESKRNAEDAPKK